MRSAELMGRARELFPGGVNSPVRAFRGVGGEPVVTARGEGARIWDVDGKEYIDFVLSWGPLVLGHASPIVLDALASAMQNGTSFGMADGARGSARRVDPAEDASPRDDAFVSSGTEATMSAVRLARAFTGRDAILKFDGCYHGHADSFLVHARVGRGDTGVTRFAGGSGRTGGADAHGFRSTISKLPLRSCAATRAV